MRASHRESGKDYPLTLGRYVLYEKIATGGMASVHFARMTGQGGFARTVAVKRMRSDIARDPEFVAMFLDEAHLSSRIEHPNVVQVIDVVAEDDEVFLVMEYVKGESLERLMRAARRRKQRTSVDVAVNVMYSTLLGLHAAHEAVGEDGKHLGIIHRDVSPPNILVSDEGVTRITDFGIAKAESRLQTTQDGQMKGKLPYLAPEQLLGKGEVDRRVDIFAAGIVFWELLAGNFLFRGNHPGETIGNVLHAPIPSLQEIRPDVSPALEACIRRALERDVQKRYDTAEQFADEIERVMNGRLGSRKKVGAWVKNLARNSLNKRANLLRQIESSSWTGPVVQPEESSQSKSSDSSSGVRSAKRDQTFSGITKRSTGSHSGLVEKPSPAVPPPSGNKTTQSGPAVPPPSGNKTTQSGPAVPPPSGNKTTQPGPVVPPPSGSKTTQPGPVVPPPSGNETKPSDPTVPPSSRGKLGQRDAGNVSGVLREQVQSNAFNEMEDLGSETADVVEMLEPESVDERPDDTVSDIAPASVSGDSAQSTNVNLPSAVSNQPVDVLPEEAHSPSVEEKLLQTQQKRKRAMKYVGAGVGAFVLLLAIIVAAWPSDDETEANPAEVHSSALTFVELEAGVVQQSQKSHVTPDSAEGDGGAADVGVNDSAADVVDAEVRTGYGSSADSESSTTVDKPRRQGTDDNRTFVPVTPRRTPKKPYLPNLP